MLKPWQKKVFKWYLIVLLITDIFWQVSVSMDKNYSFDIYRLIYSFFEFIINSSTVTFIIAFIVIIPTYILSKDQKILNSSPSIIPNPNEKISYYSYISILFGAVSKIVTLMLLYMPLPLLVTIVITLQLRITGKFKSAKVSFIGMLLAIIGTILAWSTPFGP